MRKRLYRIAIGFGALVLLIRIADWAARHGHALPASPQPNGYDELVSDACSIKQPSVDFSELASGQIRLLAGQNRPAIERARKAFQMDSGVSLETKKDWQDRHEGELKDLKQLAVALAVEAKCQLLDSHTNEAARCNVDVIRLAQRMRKGGILVDGITSLALEAIGSASLQAMLPQLDAIICRDAVHTLEELDARREMPETIITTEKTWSARRFGLIDRIGGFVARKANAKRYSQFIQRSYQTHNRTQRVMLQLAARAYELEHQQPAVKVSDLIPAYLKAVPRDWETGKEIQELPPLVR